MNKPVKRTPDTSEYLMLSSLIEYWKSKGATDKDEQDLFNRLNKICYESDSSFVNGQFGLQLNEDYSFDAMLIEEFPEECDGDFIEFWVDTE